MQQVAILLAAAALGVDWGVQRQDDGQLEYVIQIEPALLDALKRGEVITSRVDPRVVNVRRFRIQVGTGELPRDLPVVGNTSEPAPDVYSSQVPNRLPWDNPDGATDADVHEARFERSTRDDRPDATLPPSKTDVRTTDDPATQYADEFNGSDMDRTDSDVASTLSARSLMDEEGLITDSTAPSYTVPPVDASAQLDPPLENVLAPPIEDHAPDPGASMDPQFAKGEASPEPTHSAAPQLSVPVPTVVRADGSSQPSQMSSGEVVSSANVALPISVESTSPARPTRPWLPLMASVLALFASVGLNLYLGWIARDMYNRYHELVSEVVT